VFQNVTLEIHAKILYRSGDVANNTLYTSLWKNNFCAS